MRPILIAILLVVSLAFPGAAQTIIRDAELEQALRQLASPVLRAAGISPSRVKIVLIKDRSLNAFIVDSRHIFIHTGLIENLDRPEELQAVIAHEAAHIANGHLVQRVGNFRVANRVSAIGFALAAAAAAKGEGKAATALAVGTSSSARRVFLSHTRAEEASADQSALRYMASAGIDPEAMVDVLDIFRGQEALRPGRQDPYARSHPLTRDRIRAVKGYAAGYKARKLPTTAASKYWYARMRAKLSAFLGNPKQTLRRKESKGKGEIATLRRAIAYSRIPDIKRALPEIDRLIAMRGNDPFYHELRGQILFEARQYPAAVSSYRKAASLAPREPLILAGLGKVLLALNSASANREALDVLTRARGRDPGDPTMLRNLAVAHAKNGQNGMASVATAERYAVLGRFKDAKVHATRALGQLPRGSKGWLRAQDVEQSAIVALRRKR